MGKKAGTDLFTLASTKRLMVAIQKRIRQEINELRPDYRYATVTQINYDNKSANVRYPEDTSDTTVKMFSQVPWRTGQKVRIAGRVGDRCIVEVMGPTAACPPGKVDAYIGSSTALPPGWLLAAGGTYDPVLYPELFLAIGTTYGGTPSTPALPDFTGYFLRGGNPGTAGGSSAHSHNLSSNGQAQIVVQNSTPDVAANVVTGVTSWNDTRKAASGPGLTSSVAHTAATPLQGATDTTSTVPPYQAVNWIIKY